MPYRILILETIRDDAASRREALAQHTPALEPYQLAYVYASERLALDQTMPMRTRLVQSQQRSLDESALLQRLTERLDAFQPDLLLVHSGAMFQTYPEELFFVLQALKAAHPKLRIGFRPRPFEKYGPKPYFEYSNELRDLMALVFADSQR